MPRQRRTATSLLVVHSFVHSFAANAFRPHRAMMRRAMSRCARAAAAAAARGSRSTTTTTTTVANDAALTSWTSSSSTSSTLSSPPRTARAWLASNAAPRHVSTSSASSSDTKTRVDALNDLFVEAREEIDAARESVGSTYFNDDYDVAKACVDDVIAAWEGVLASLRDEDEKAAMRRSMGLKIEQLKGEFALLDRAHDDHD